MTGSSNLGGSYRATISIDRLTSLDPQMPFQWPDRLPASRRSCPRPWENGRGGQHCLLALFAT